MVQTLLEGLKNFALAAPTNLFIVIIVVLIMKFAFKAKTRDCIYVVVAYLLIGFLLTLFGVKIPSFLAIGKWFVKLFKSIFK